MSLFLFPLFVHVFHDVCVTYPGFYLDLVGPCGV